ncbi:MAG: creatininase family protein [Gemmatimonadota bacterium]
MPLPLPARSCKLIKEMRPADIAAAVAADPRLILPVGTCEQHGPHLPLGCDTIIVEQLADDLSAEFGVLRAPTLEFGVNTATARRYAGNASLRRKTLHRALNDLIDSWEASGIREFILLTAHEHDGHIDALATVVTSGARVRVVDLFDVDLTDLLEDQSDPIHGGEVDTSLMLYLAPDLVRLDLALDYTMATRDQQRYRKGWLKIPELSPGSVGRPSLASPEKGHALYQRIHSQVRERVLLASADS